LSNLLDHQDHHDFFPLECGTFKSADMVKHSLNKLVNKSVSFYIG